MKFGFNMLSGFEEKGSGELKQSDIAKTCPCNIQQLFTALKVNFQMKNCDIFLLFAQNIDCGYTLEPFQ